MKMLIMSLCFLLMLKFCDGAVLTRRGMMTMSSKLLVGNANIHASYIESVAKASPPRMLDSLLRLLELEGNEIVDPQSYRRGINPFFIPLAKSKDNSLIGYIRWPTQKDDMDLQIVRTNEVGLQLLALGTTQMCHRIAVEQDFYSTPTAKQAVEFINKDKNIYESGDYLPFLRSGKFPTLTENDLRLVLDRFILTKVGAFPDCYERIASNFLEKGNDVSALVTCERAVSIFYGWGHPIAYHSFTLNKLNGRDKEARDAARAAMGMPAWTVSSTKSELEDLSKLAGFSGSAILGEMHAYRANDPRKDDIGEGLSPIQVTLDQAAHLMDAVALGHTINGTTGWEGIRETLATKYTEGGYPEMAEFILSN